MGRCGSLMRWIILCIAVAAPIIPLSKNIAADVMFAKGTHSLREQRTAEGMEYLRLGYEFCPTLDRAQDRSRLLLALSQAAPTKFRWPMMRLILRIAAEQVWRHPDRPEAWAMMANAQIRSGQMGQARKSSDMIYKMDPYGVSISY